MGDVLKILRFTTAICERCGVLASGNGRYVMLVRERARNHAEATGHAVLTEISAEAPT